MKTTMASLVDERRDAFTVKNLSHSVAGYFDAGLRGRKFQNSRICKDFPRSRCAGSAENRVFLTICAFISRVKFSRPAQYSDKVLRLSYKRFSHFKKVRLIYLVTRQAHRPINPNLWDDLLC